MPASPTASTCAIPISLSVRRRSTIGWSAGRFRLRIKSRRLDTSAEWLRHGRLSGTEGAASPQEALLLKYFRLLPPKKRDALMVLLYHPDDG